MKRVDKDNGILANLTHQSLRLEPARQRRTTRGVPEFDRIRSQAESLYRVLKKNLCCSCNNSHHANLRLEARISPDNPDVGNKLRFRMVFSFDTTDPAGSQVLWKLRETEIETLEIQEQIDALTKGLPLPSPFPSPGIKKGVTWAVEPPGTPSPPPPYLEPTTTQINDLCLAFQDYTGTDGCLGYILDEKRMRHHIYPISSPMDQTSRMATSLYTRLTGPRTSVAKLTRKERLQLALTLSASVLQLHKTPWLNERWTINDIQFLSGNPNPYISHTFQGNHPEDDTVSDTTKSLPIVRNETLFALGVSLIELCLGSSLASFRTDEDLSPDPQLTNFMTARRLISDVYDEGGGRYGDAVRRCVHCEFDQRKASLDIEAFRTCFFQGVVVPLEEDWVDFNSMNSGSRL
jgi:hypothetical protein